MAGVMVPANVRLSRSRVMQSSRSMVNLSGAGMRAVGGGRATKSSSSSSRFARTSLSRSPLRLSRQSRVVPCAGNMGMGGAGTSGGGRGQQMMKKKLQIPEVDKENPQFVIFVRSSKVKMWYPLNIVSGGPLAKGLIAGLENDFLKGLANGALLNSLQEVVYKDVDAVEKAARDTIKPLAAAKELTYGFKIMDANDPEGSVTPKGVKQIPLKGEESGGGFDGLKTFAEGYKNLQKMLNDGEDGDGEGGLNGKTGAVIGAGVIFLIFAVSYVAGHIGAPPPPPPQ